VRFKGRYPPPQPGRYGILSLFLMVCIKEIFARGRGYEFPRPPHCLKEGCGSNRVWGHGYVGVWFYGYTSLVYLKRYRCADCGCVYTVRPSECWPRHRTPIIIILRRISHRIREGVWDKSCGLTRQMQGNWLRALKKNIKTYLGMDFAGELMEGFHELISAGRIPVQRIE
jgi:hypothetical protein